MAFISGEKIDLRVVVRNDLPHYQRWLDDPQVTEFLEMGARPTRESDCEAFWRLANEADDAVVFTIVDRETGDAIGICGLYQIQWICRRAQFNILSGEPASWDKGFGGEATRLTLEYGFNKLNLEAIHLGVNAENKRAIRSYEKVGFVHEGVRRRFIYRNGQYYDVVYMGILREEFAAQAG